MSVFMLSGAYAQISSHWRTGCFASHHHPWDIRDVGETLKIENDRIKMNNGRLWIVNKIFYSHWPDFYVFGSQLGLESNHITFYITLISKMIFSCITKPSKVFILAKYPWMTHLFLPTKSTTMGYLFFLTRTI